MININLSKIVKKFVREIFKLNFGKIKLSNNINYSTKILQIEKYKNDIFEDKKYFIYSTDNCRIYTDLNENVAVIKDNIILNGHSFQQIRGNLEKINLNSVFQNGTPYIKKKIKGTIFNLLQGASGENYFHFLFDILPKIWLLKSKIALAEIDFFLVNKKIDWQIKIFKMIGINEKKILSAEINRHIDADKIVSVTHPWYFEGYVQEQVGNLPNWIINDLRSKFLKNTNSQSNLKIFLDRSGSKFNHLKILNNEEVINLLKKKGYQIIRPENLSFKEQIDLFSNAKTIIGAHGAALTNIVFCREKTNIIEIIPSSHPSQKCKRLSSILNLKYFRLITEDTKNDEIFPYYINMNLDILENVVSEYSDI